jgi:hypothetical protein
MRDETTALINATTIATSYLAAADYLGIDFGEIKKAIMDMALHHNGCVACLYSRAPHDATEYARKRGTLPLMMRGCALRRRPDRCSSFEPIIPGVQHARCAEDGNLF